MSVHFVDTFSCLWSFEDEQVRVDDYDDIG